MTDAPLLDGIHHLKLPVSDLQRSLTWYQDRLGYLVMKEFVEEGVLMGIAMTHPNGGPDLAIRLDPERARVAAGFDYFAIGVPGQDAIEALAARFTERDGAHAGVHRTPVGGFSPACTTPMATRSASTPFRSGCPPTSALPTRQTIESARRENDALQSPPWTPSNR